MYECRKFISFGRRRPLTEAKQKDLGTIPPRG
jgi:hypothetical protein